MNDSDATEPIQDLDESADGEFLPAPDAPQPGVSADVPAKTDSDERHDELSDIIENAESHPQPTPPEDQPLSAEQAAAEQSGSYVYPDGGAASSQRLRPIPPNGVRVSWWTKYRRQLIAVEWGLTGLFFLLALYFLVMWIFAKPALACVPDASWKVAAAPGRWKNIVVHHTATERSSPQSIDRYHREVRKWDGMGYHFVIGNGRTNGRDPTLADGAVHAGIRWLEQRGGAHVRMKEVRNANSFSIGIALIGNFEQEPPTPRQIAALRCLMGFLSEEYGIPRRNIFGHGKVSEKHTLCPGKLLPLSEVISSLP